MTSIAQRWLYRNNDAAWRDDNMAIAPASRSSSVVRSSI